MEDAGSINSDQAWKDLINKVDKTMDFTCSVPTTLQTELRPYQTDGFNWMMRLAEWGVGACLSDDMALGKTIQTLALLLKRAQNGPVIVVAPASVVPNWVNETKIFAPTLSPIVLSGGDRSKIVSNLKPFDVLVVSYGLLMTVNSALSEIHWNTTVLDEAHAIKNVFAKRTKAVMQLKGDFKLLTTGTPIQNNLGELWSLFNFINPGLLFTQKEFNNRFGVAPTDVNYTLKRKQLKRLLTPFILRRLKSQVLDYLPAKTEITLSVDLSEMERAFYEALRVKASENIEEKDSNNKGGNHIKVKQK